MDTIHVYLASILLIHTLCLPPDASELNDYICYVDSNETYIETYPGSKKYRPSSWYTPIGKYINLPYPNSVILNTSNYVDVQCIGGLIGTLMKCKHVLHPSRLKLTECNLYTTQPLAISLRTINIEVTKLTHLELNDIGRKELRSVVFNNLNLMSITMSYKIRIVPAIYVPHRPVFKLIDALTNVTEIKLKNYILSPLPPSRIKYMTLINSNLEEYDFGDCKELIELNLIDFDLKSIVLEKCFKLEILRITGREVTKFDMFYAGMNVKYLKELIVHGSPQLDEFGSIEFMEAKQLRRLDLSGNRLYNIELNNFPKLENLNLSSNQFNRSGVVQALTNATSLRKLTLDYNPNLDICDFEHTNITLAHQSLQRLSLAGTKTRSMCFHLLESLEYLDLRNCNITELKFGALPQSRAPLLEVDLRDNQLYNVTFGEKDYDRLRYYRDDAARNASIKIYADVPPLDCDCNYAYLASAHRERTLNITNMRCVDGTALEDIPARVLECDRYNCDNCTCRQGWSDGWTVADCLELNLLSLPSILGVHELQAGGNSIEKINASILINGNFTKLNLTDNKISSLDETVVEALFAANRQVWLAGNPIICDCDNRLLIEGLQAHSSQVKDYLSVSCVGTGQPVHNVSVASLCAVRRGSQWPALLGGGGALVALAALAGALHLRNGRVLQVFLYARGWCLCCVREDELDADRIYDAFVSFSHHDEAFVVDELVPGLESARDYRLCVHFRDWMAGEWIPEQIARSVEQSRRTVIVLSKSYLESTWGLLEFRMAHASAMEEGRARIIVIVLDEVVEDERLDAELRSYLRTNTYVRWGDRWFWEKLQYAMPRGALRGRQIVGGDLPELEILPRIP